MTRASNHRTDNHSSMTRTILVMDADAGVRAAALHCLKPPSCRVAAISGAGDPKTIAREHPADLVVLGSVERVEADRSSSLRKAFQKPVVPLFRPSVYSRRRAGLAALGPDLMLGLADCRIRIGQHLEARATSPEMAVRWGGFTLKLEPAAFAYQGKSLGLTNAQGAILALLMLYGGEIVSRRMIEDFVFHGKPRSQTNFISVHVSRLRAKLRENRSEVFIENVKGDGYALFWNRSFSTECIPEPEMFVPNLEGGARYPALYASVATPSEVKAAGLHRCLASDGESPTGPGAQVCEFRI